MAGRVVDFSVGHDDDGNAVVWEVTKRPIERTRDSSLAVRIAAAFLAGESVVLHRDDEGFVIEVKGGGAR